MENLSQYADQLRPIQIEGIRAVLTEPTYTEAAARVGISRTTLWRWMRQPAFKEALRAGIQAQIDAIWADIRSQNL